MKTTLLFFAFMVSQVSFAVDKISCEDQDSLFTTFEVTQLEDFGTVPDGLSADLELEVKNSICNFQGVYQESWDATCFKKEDLKNLTSGAYISALFMSGYEHGSLTATKTQYLSCQAF